MAIPDDTWTEEPQISAYLKPRDVDSLNTLTSSDAGPTELFDSSQGLRARIWEANYDKDRFTVVLEGYGDLFYYPDIDQISLTFDLLGAPFVSFISSKKLYIWFYDSVEREYKIEYVCPADQCLCYLDERRTKYADISDILVLYTFNDDVAYRQQRDRYTIEYPVPIEFENILLVNFGMTEGSRMMIKYREGYGYWNAVCKDNTGWNSLC